MKRSTILISELIRAGVLVALGTFLWINVLPRQDYGWAYRLGVLVERTV